MKFNTGLLFSSLLLAIKAADTTTADKTCNPLLAVCAPNPALATDIVEDFTAPSSDFEIMSTKSGVFYNDDGLQLKLSKRFDNPSVMSTFYIMFGRTELHIKAAPGKGIISSFFLQSDDLDEIDLEFVGGDDTEFQSNWFSKGNVATYDRGAFHPTQGAPQDNFGNYTILWTEDSIEWWYNGNLVRTLLPNNGQGYPQSPMKIFAGIWAGGDPDNQPGTIEWAGGETDYSQAPFSMYISKLIVNDFSTGKAYKYTDKTGSWESIEAEGGKVNGRINQANYNPSGNDHQALVSISSSSASPSSSPSSSSVVSSSVSSSVASSSSASSSSSSASSSAGADSSCAFAFLPRFVQAYSNK